MKLSINNDWLSSNSLPTGALLCFLLFANASFCQVYFSKYYDFDNHPNYSIKGFEHANGFFIAGGASGANNSETRRYLVTDHFGDTVLKKEYQYNNLSVRDGDLLQLSDSLYIDARTIQRATFPQQSWIELQAVNLKGDSIWRKSYKANGLKELTTPRLCSLSDSIILLTGRLYNSDSNSDPLLIAIDLQGNEIWRKTIHTLESEVIWSAAKVSSNKFILAGTGNSNTKSKYSSYVLCINSAGDSLWSKYFHEGHTTFPNLTPLIDGNFIFTTDSFESIVNRNEFAFKQIFKIDSLGNIIWRQVHKDKKRGDSRYSKCIESPDSSLYVFGRTGERGLEYTLTKLTSEGKQIWMHQYDRGRGGDLWDFIRTKDEGFLFIGDNFPPGSGGTQDIWLLKAYKNGCVDPSCTSLVYSNDIGIQESTTTSNFYVFPNPSNGEFTLAWHTDKSTSNTEIEIHNLLGKTIHSVLLQNDKGKQTVVLPTHAAGIYSLTVKNKNEIIHQQRLVVQ